MSITKHILDPIYRLSEDLSPMEVVNAAEKAASELELKFAKLSLIVSIIELMEPRHPKYNGYIQQLTQLVAEMQK